MCWQTRTLYALLCASTYLEKAHALSSKKCWKRPLLAAEFHKVTHFVTCWLRTLPPYFTFLILRFLNPQSRRYIPPTSQGYWVDKSYVGEGTWLTPRAQAGKPTKTFLKVTLRARESSLWFHFYTQASVASWAVWWKGCDLQFQTRPHWSGPHSTPGLPRGDTSMTYPEHRAGSDSSRAGYQQPRGFLTLGEKSWPPEGGGRKPHHKSHPQRGGCFLRS